MIRLLFETFTFEVQKDEVKMPEFLNIRLTRSLVGPLDPDMNNHVPYDSTNYSDTTYFNVRGFTIFAMFQYIAPNDDDQSLRRQELYFLASKLLFLPGLDSWWCTNFDTN